MSAIRKAAGKACEFVFLDGPIVLQPPDMPLEPGMIERPPEIEQEVDPELIPRAWWRSSEDRTVYQGVNETLIYVRDFLKREMEQKGPFEAVLGFSQGASMAALLTIILERPTAYTPVPFVDPSTQQPIHPPFKRAVYGSGFRPNDKSLSRLFEGDEGQKLLGTETKTLHVIGRMDPVVSLSRMRSLVDCCVEENMRIEEHDGGHFIPSQSNWRMFLANWLGSQDASLVPSPSPSVSGTSTPVKENANRL